MGDLNLIQQYGGIIEKPSLGFDEIARKINANATKGLNKNEVVQRKQWYGSNAKDPPRIRGLARIIWDIFKDPMLRILVVASFVTIIINESIQMDERDIAWIDGVAMLVGVSIVIFVGAFNDYKKERQFLKLTKAADSEKTVNCIRQNLEADIEKLENKEEKKKEARVHRDDLVVGDLIRIENGKTIPADGLLVEGKDIEIDESAMTGESKKVKKMCFDECMQKWNSLSEEAKKTASPSSVPSPVLLSGTKV